MAPALDKISKEFRSAILCGDHTLAVHLLSEYAVALQALWESLPVSERAASSIPQQSDQLLTWAHGMTLVQRTMAAEHLTVIEKASRYNVG
jgi:hypothetical protein